MTKRLSIQRRAELIFAFFRDARATILKHDAEAVRANAQLQKQVRRQIENAVRDALEARIWPELEFSNEELCPACGVPTVQHGTIKAGKWNVTICAGVSGQNLFVIGPDAAIALVEQLKENDARESEPNQPPEVS